jgi:hypothetical protein
MAVISLCAPTNSLRMASRKRSLVEISTTICNANASSELPIKLAESGTLIEFVVGAGELTGIETDIRFSGIE